MTTCNICPRKCNVPRSVSVPPGKGEGFCQMGRLPVVARSALHFWEEPCISGTGGSGTIFFSGCNLKCVFCQNHKISNLNFGREITVARLRELFISLIAQGAHNINLVNPTHFIESISSALDSPLPVPIVYNSSGYENVESLKLLDGKIDIYLPDMKYIDPIFSQKYSHAPDYFEIASSAIKEMYRQVGAFKIDEKGLLKRGLMVRHLILPNHAADSMDVIDWFSSTFPKDTVLFSLMSQYLPFSDSSLFPELNRKITKEEYAVTEEYLFASGIEQGFVQELDSATEDYIPDFNLEGVPADL